MYRSSGSIRPVIPVQQVKKSLQDDQELNIVISKILSLDPPSARMIIRGTSITAYRRVHEIISGVLDRILDDIRGLRTTQQKQLERVRNKLIELSKCLILVNYQEARNQISSELANYLKEIINFATDTIRKSNNINTIESVISRSRTLIDAYGVLVYKYGRK
ncbi:MAG: hypothetical protein B6U89_07320 [Desulfurococcales archaeon ex4484_58]|nr:MAG: hypothetical protein B6U89_07320 [Desulfurococcales archaeon ex4484_58]